jgi:hypothetical protein
MRCLKGKTDGTGASRGRSAAAPDAVSPPTNQLSRLKSLVQRWRRKPLLLSMLQFRLDQLEVAIEVTFGDLARGPLGKRALGRVDLRRDQVRVLHLGHGNLPLKLLPCSSSKPRLGDLLREDPIDLRAADADVSQLAVGEMVKFATLRFATLPCPITAEQREDHWYRSTYFRAWRRASDRRRSCAERR